jgi:hypothetical protein
LFSNTQAALWSKLELANELDARCHHHGSKNLANSHDAFLHTVSILHLLRKPPDTSGSGARLQMEQASESYHLGPQVPTQLADVWLQDRAVLPAGGIPGAAVPLHTFNGERQAPRPPDVQLHIEAAHEKTHKDN